MTRDDLPRPCFWKKGRERSFCCCYSHSRGSVCSGGHEVGSRSAPSGGLGVFPDSTDIPCQSAVSLRMGQVQIPSSKQQQKCCGERSVKNLAHPRLPPQSGDVDHQRKEKRTSLAVVGRRGWTPERRGKVLRHVSSVRQNQIGWDDSCPPAGVDGPRVAQVILLTCLYLTI